MEPLVIEALAVLGKHPNIIQATVDAAVAQKTPETKKRESKLKEICKRLDEMQKETEWLDNLIHDKKRPHLAERMLDKVEYLLVDEKRLKDERRVLELTIQHDEQKAFNREAVVKSLTNLGGVIDALPPSQRRELLQLLINRIVVKPWGGEQVGIQGGSIVITPEIGTKRYLVNISLPKVPYYQQSLPIRSMVRPSQKLAGRDPQTYELFLAGQATIYRRPSRRQDWFPGLLCRPDSVPHLDRNDE